MPGRGEPWPKPCLSEAAPKCGVAISGDRDRPAPTHLRARFLLFTVPRSACRLLIPAELRPLLTRPSHVFGTVIAFASTSDLQAAGNGYFRPRARLSCPMPARSSVVAPRARTLRALLGYGASSTFTRRAWDLGPGARRPAPGA